MPRERFRTSRERVGGRGVGVEAGAAEGGAEGGGVDGDDRLEAGGGVVGEDDLLVLGAELEDVGIGGADMGGAHFLCVGHGVWWRWCRGPAGVARVRGHIVGRRPPSIRTRRGTAAAPRRRGCRSPAAARRTACRRRPPSASRRRRSRTSVGHGMLVGYGASSAPTSAQVAGRRPGSRALPAAAVAAVAGQHPPRRRRGAASVVPSVAVRSAAAPRSVERVEVRPRGQRRVEAEELRAR